MSELEEVGGWTMSELENDEVGKCRSWLLSGWQASELDFDVDPSNRYWFTYTYLL